MTGRHLIYRYGASAWLWRALGALALALSALILVGALRASEPYLLAVAAPLALPVLALFPCVATRIELEDAREAEVARVHVETLAGVTRRISLDRLRGARHRETAQSDGAEVYAPRAWILVRGALPVYVDLLATIPDRARFTTALGLPARALPRR